ncbi:MAG: hypothetical protein ACRELS_02555 [Candidatus Rokuibacteriota bacterium]
MKPIRLSDRALLQVAFRGCSESEVIDAIQTIPWRPAELGRLECRKDFAYRRERNGVPYRSKQVHPVFVEASTEIVVVTVEVCYFRESQASYVLSPASRRPNSTRCAPNRRVDYPVGPPRRGSRDRGRAPR